MYTRNVCYYTSNKTLPVAHRNYYVSEQTLAIVYSEARLRLLETYNK